MIKYHLKIKISQSQCFYLFSVIPRKINKLKIHINQLGIKRTLRVHPHVYYIRLTKVGTTANLRSAEIKLMVILSFNFTVNYWI